MIAYESEVEGGESARRASVWRDCTRGACRGPAACNWYGCIRIASRAMCSGRRRVIAGPTVDNSLRMIAEAGRGALVYLHHTQRGFTLDRAADPTSATARICLHRAGSKPVNGAAPRAEPDQRILRQVGLGGQILSDLGLRKIRLLSNHRTHVPALQGFGIEIVEQVPVTATAHPVTR